MTNIEIRRYTLRHYIDLQAVRLSNKQYHLLRYLMRVATITTAELSELRDISIPNAGHQLANLYHKGYLVREEIQDPTGGIFYEYAINPLL